MRDSVELADPYFQKLIDIAPEEIFTMYQNAIEKELLHVSSRQVYRTACTRIKKLMRIDAEKTKKLIE